MAIDQTAFNEVQDHASQMRSDQASRTQMYDEIESMYLMEPKGIPSAAWIKQTISPDARNALIGAVRLMTATDPVWSVPTTTSDTATAKKSSDLEKFCSACWQAAGRIRRKPLHYDAVLSALMYGEVHISVTSTKDLVEFHRAKGGDARAEYASGKTPILFEVLSPYTGYCDFDSLGLSAYYQRQEMTAGAIRARWGSMAEKQVAGKKSYEKVYLCDFWDQVRHAVYIEGGGDPILFEEHGLPFIPVAAQITEGSSLFNKSSQQSRQPFLYTLWKSGLWERENLSLTVMYSMIFSIGSNPMFLYRRNSPDKTIAERVDYSTPGGVVELDPGEDFSPLAKQVIDPSMMQGLQIAQDKVSESTMYRQALGQPLEGNAPFSTVSLLSQAGRLPLVPYQRMTGWVIGDAMQIGLRMLKEQGGEQSVYSDQGDIKVKANDIPDNVEISATLDIAMPQDDRQNVVTAAQATGGDNPLVSQRYAREAWLKVGQSDDMQEEIWAERFANVQAQLELQKQMQKAQQQAAGQQSGQMPQGQPGATPQYTPEALQVAQQAQAQSMAQPWLPASGPMMEQGAPGQEEQGYGNQYQ